MRTRLIVLLQLFLTGLLVSSGINAASPLPVQSVSGSGVTVKATPRALPGGSWEIEIVFDTHSQELKDDLTKSASLIAGGKTYAPVSWQGDPPGGHHRKGMLKFGAVEPRPQEIELRIARPGEPKPRSFRWQLK
jgi:hypothetical protein